MLSKTDWFHRKEQALIGFSKMSNKRRLETIWSMLETETMMDEEGKTYFLEVLDFYEKVVVGEREGVAKEIQKEVVECFNFLLFVLFDRCEDYRYAYQRCQNNIVLKTLGGDGEE